MRDFWKDWKLSKEVFKESCFESNVEIQGVDSKAFLPFIEPSKHVYILWSFPHFLTTISSIFFIRILCNSPTQTNWTTSKMQCVEEKRHHEHSIPTMKQYNAGIMLLLCFYLAGIGKLV